MTGMHFQRKRSERGASLIMLVSIIGLAFIVTVAGFLVAASDSQDTARLASAKVDIATREDALMREILQQTATGMLPGTDGFTGPILTWTQIMTLAVNNLHATSYVDPAELTALQTAGAIPANVTLANTGDTGGALLGIFQGYNNEVPYGGTSGLANLVPVNAALAAVEPPLMNWSGQVTTLTAATALTTPQEFFLGSLYTGSSPPLSASKRWGLIIYPNIRFGYKQPGDSIYCPSCVVAHPASLPDRPADPRGPGRSHPDLPLSERSGQLRPVGIRNSLSASDLRERESSNWRQCGWHSLGKRGLDHGLDLWKPDSVGRRNL